jgi:DHA3 family macrolide efflux protein-like MFS transporter
VNQHGVEVERKSFTHDLRDGIRYVVTWRGLTVIVLMAMAINFLLSPAGALMPILVTQHYNGAAPQLAMMEAVFGIGMIAGGLLLSVWGGFKRRIITSMMGLLLLGISFTVQGVLPSNLFVVAMIAGTLGGISQPITNGPLFAVLQATVAPNMQGRVMSLLGALSIAVTPLSLLVAGPIADAFGVQVWYLVGGVVCFVLGVAGFFIPPLMNIESEMQQAQPAVVDEVLQPGIAVASK